MLVALLWVATIWVLALATHLVVVRVTGYQRRLYDYALEKISKSEAASARIELVQSGRIAKALDEIEEMKSALRSTSQEGAIGKLVARLNDISQDMIELKNQFASMKHAAGWRNLFGPKPDKPPEPGPS